MNNKIELKKYIKITFILTLFLTISFIILHIYQYKVYTSNYNKSVSSILEIVKKEYPKIDEIELINILNKETFRDTNFLKDYGIDIKSDSVILINDKTQFKFLILTTMHLIISFTIIITIFLIYNHKKDKKITEITKLIEEINKKNYSLEIDSNTEDELSILKNEIYKTTILLKETAENSINDKLHLKDSLGDISHQLKTPLTSIMISLDNIIDNPDMDSQTRFDFIHNIQRETNNINFLIQSILKLTKLDTNMVLFKQEEVKVIDIINESVKNVSMLCELKNIKIKVKGDKNLKINCDFKWQIEAITNILKNCVEYSNENSTVDIKYKDSKLYIIIEIEDNKGSLKKEEVTKIFKRFYKGENSCKDSVGIGLALSKEVIEKDNGRVSASVTPGLKTTFTIKYFK